MSDHKATPEQWNAMERHGHAYHDSFASCILELRRRLDALEDALATPAMVVMGEPFRPAPARPADPVPLADPEPLVDQVADAISAAPVLGRNLEQEEARHAIRAVVAWLRRNDWPDPAQDLEDEADRA